jgi:hypothetical protein
MKINSKQIDSVELIINKSNEKQDYINPQIIELMASDFIQDGGPDTYESTNGAEMLIINNKRLYFYR